MENLGGWRGRLRRVAFLLGRLVGAGPGREAAGAAESSPVLQSGVLPLGRPVRQRRAADATGAISTATANTARERRLGMGNSTMVRMAAILTRTARRVMKTR